MWLANGLALFKLSKMNRPAARLIASLNVIVILEFLATPVAALSGLNVNTGGCESAVVKVMLVGSGAMALLNKSSTPAIAT